MKELQVNMESVIKNVEKDVNIIYVAYGRELVIVEAAVVMIKEKRKNRAKEDDKCFLYGAQRP
ncbi:hypothetical protein [Bacillus sp. (in: firmicutes)]|uniref:hypothetical protein n=1 Tax=Bacillus sp. TaxID=1409 RepID=UPI0039E3D5FC